MNTIIVNLSLLKVKDVKAMDRSSCKKMETSDNRGVANGGSGGAYEHPSPQIKIWFTILYYFVVNICNKSNFYEKRTPQIEVWLRPWINTLKFEIEIDFLDTALNLCNLKIF